MCITLLFQSCQGQVLDLEKLNLPIKGDQLKGLELSSSGTGIGTKEVQYVSYISDHAKMISFGGIGIKQPNTGTEPLVRFYSKDAGNSFQGYTLNILNPDAFEKTLAYLLKNKTSFKLVFDDGKDNEERARVFISTKEGTTYLLLSRLNSQGKKTGYIDGISKTETALLLSRLGGAFAYYEAFLEYRKHKSANFNYLDFLRETNNDLYRKSNNLK